ncbi:unnamed protein product [Calicophoron daubneyi]
MSEVKSPHGLRLDIELENSSGPKAPMPKKLIERLNNSGKLETSHDIERELDVADKRRLSLQADRTEKLRQHLEHVEKIAKLKQRQHTVSEECGDEEKSND